MGVGDGRVVRHMKKKSVVLGTGTVLCPCCGYALRVGATVRLQATREIGQMTVGEEPQPTLHEKLDGFGKALKREMEADRDG